MKIFLTAWIACLVLLGCLFGIVVLLEHERWLLALFFTSGLVAAVYALLVEVG